MRVKQYSLYKTAKKTAKENNLVIAENSVGQNKKRLFDFSDIDNNHALRPEEKDCIKRSAMEHISPWEKTDFYGMQIDNFSYFNGVTTFIMHRVYKKDGTHLYNIFQAVANNHHRYERKCTWDEYRHSGAEMMTGWNAPIYDYEI